MQHLSLALLALLALISPGTPSLPTAPPFQEQLARAGAEDGEALELTLPTGRADEPRPEVPFVQWLDVDGDGREELFLLHPGGQAVLYTDPGSGDWNASNESFGLGELAHLRSARWLDVDLDGAPDLFAVDLGGHARLYGNRSGVLEEMSASAGVELQGLRAAAWTDFDADGDPDLVSVSAAGAELRVNDGAGVFSIRRLGADLAVPSVTDPLGRPTQVGGAGASAPRSLPIGDALPKEIVDVVGKPAAGLTTRRGLADSPDASKTPGFEVIEELATAGLLNCVVSIADAAGGPCLLASSSPALGTLYPQTLHLNVDANTNRVGVGTLAPLAKLDIEATQSGLGLRSHTGADFAAGTFLTDSVNAFGLDVRSMKRAAAFQGEVYFGRDGMGPLIPHAILNVDANLASQFQMMSPTGLPMVEIRSYQNATTGALMRLNNLGGHDTLRLNADSSKSGGLLQMDQATGTQTVQLMASDKDSDGAELLMWTSAGDPTVRLISEEGPRNGAQLTLGLDTGTDSIVLDAQMGSTGAGLIMSDSSGVATVDLRAEQVAGQGARLLLKRPNATSTVILDADTTVGSALYLLNNAGVETVGLFAQEAAGNGSQLQMGKSDGTTTFVLDAETSAAAELSMRTDTGLETIELVSQEAAGNGAQLVLRKYDGTTTFVLDAEAGPSGEFSMRNSSGQETVEIVAEEVAGNGAQIVLRRSDGTASIVLDAEQGGTGRITTQILEITGGSDLVEGFDTGTTPCEPGSVLVIDEHGSELALSARPYDRRVAGVVSGAGGIRPGLLMGQTGVADGDTKVALSGRVFARCNTENGPVSPGDLLTSSSTLGEAMRATDPARSHGAVIGKALGSLTEARGLVLILVSLQ